MRACWTIRVILMSLTVLVGALQNTNGSARLEKNEVTQKTTSKETKTRRVKSQNKSIIKQKRNEVPYLSISERQRLKNEWDERQTQERQLYEDNAYLNDLETWKHSWNYLHVIVVPQEAEVTPPNNNVLAPGQVLADNAAVTNIRGNQVGRSKQGCIRNTNFLCTWTIFLASIVKSGCDVMLQGIYIPVQPLTSFGVPVDQFASIVGGTGPCRGITGEVKISPRTLSFPTSYDYEFYYIIRG